MTSSFNASDALRRALAPAGATRAWAQNFYAQSAHFGLSIGDLNKIVAASGSLADAEAAAARMVAAGRGSPGLRMCGQIDVAQRISAAHAKAHQPMRTPRSP